MSGNTQDVTHSSSTTDTGRQNKLESRKYVVFCAYIAAPFGLFVLAQIGWVMQLSGWGVLWLLPLALLIPLALVRSMSARDRLHCLLGSAILFVALCAVTFVGYADAVAVWVVGNDNFNQHSALVLPGSTGDISGFFTKIGGLLIINFVATSCYFQLFQSRKRSILRIFVMVLLVAIFMMPSIGISIITNSGW